MFSLAIFEAGYTFDRNQIENGKSAISSLRAFVR